jgi:UDP-N-acetylmuramoyl-tripeptide--D-alanyl-D-alanine ligase
LHRQRSGITILAITGSNGKTTTKELCAAVLARRFKVCATTGNLNNHIGVPLTLLAMAPGTEIGIVEMGANHPGEIRDLCNIARPDAGLITNVGKAHLEGFGSIEGVAAAKGELFDFLISENKTIFLNEGNEYLKIRVPASYPQTKHYNGKHGVFMLNKHSNPFLTLSLQINDSVEQVETRLLGQYNAENVMAACCVGLHFGISFEGIQQGIEAYSPQNNRSQLIESGRNRLYMDAYNANPSSMRAALEEFLQLTHERKMIVMGEMRELGDASKAEHEALIGFLRDRFDGQVFCIGEAFSKIPDAQSYTCFATADELVRHLNSHPIEGYFILIKGSRSNRLEKVAAVL